MMMVLIIVVISFSAARTTTVNRVHSFSGTTMSIQEVLQTTQRLVNLEVWSREQAAEILLEFAAEKEKSEKYQQQLCEVFDFENDLDYVLV